MKNLLLILSCTLSFSLFSQMSGPSIVVINEANTYSYNSGFYVIGGVNWSATDGTIVSTSQSGSTYSASISFQSSGLKTITAKHGFNNNILGTYSVTVTGTTLSAGTIGNAQTLCYNENPSALSNMDSASGGNGSYTYQWQQNSVGGWTHISGATSVTYDPPVLTSTKQYRRRVTSGGETKYSNMITVTIYPNLIAGSIGNAQTIPYNGNPSALTNTASASGGSGSKQYQWQHRSPGGSWSSISGATSITYDPPALTSTKEYRRRVRTSECSSYKYTNTIKITVLP